MQRSCYWSLILPIYLYQKRCACLFSVLPLYCKFRVYSKKHVKKERSRERAELAKAWNLLDPLGRGALSIEDEKFRELFNLLKPKNSEAENFMLIEVLDANEDGEVDSFEWTTMLRQVLSLEFEDDNEMVLLDETLGLSKWMLRIRESAQFLTDSEFFSHFILFLIILHCILFVLKWKGQSQEVELTVQVITSVIVTIFLFEGATRLLSVGKRILDPLEIMDLALTMLAFISNFLWYSHYPHYFWFRDSAATISSLAVFCRLPFNNRQLKEAVSIFLRVAPVMVDLLCLLGIISFLLASVGMELFHLAPETSDGYMYLPACGLGFKTFWCSCLILFQMVTTSNWHEIMNSVSWHFCLKFFKYFNTNELNNKNSNMEKKWFRKKFYYKHRTTPFPMHC